MSYVIKLFSKGYLSDYLLDKIKKLKKEAIDSKNNSALRKKLLDNYTISKLCLDTELRNWRKEEKNTSNNICNLYILVPYYGDGELLYLKPRIFQYTIGRTFDAHLVIEKNFLWQKKYIKISLNSSWQVKNNVDLEDDMKKDMNNLKINVANINKEIDAYNKKIPKAIDDALLEKKEMADKHVCTLRGINIRQRSNFYDSCAKTLRSIISALKRIVDMILVYCKKTIKFIFKCAYLLGCFLSVWLVELWPHMHHYMKFILALIWRS